ncbi:hypothetical protein [Streptomyces sp. NPDC001851]|uniref:hypothetical protein n=1 Tax=Streptomyces sp. NPDC001851 TaxID=3154529 RepID=UPI00331F3042
MSAEDTPRAPSREPGHQLTRIVLPARLLSESLTAQRFDDHDHVPTMRRSAPAPPPTCPS